MPFLARSLPFPPRDRLLGLVSFLAAVICAAYLLFGFGYSYSSETASGSVGTDGAVVPVTITEGWESALTYARRNQDYAIVGWAALVLGLGVLTAVAAWRGRPAPVWVAALLLLTLSVLGVASIGLFVMPVALLVFATALATSAARRRGRVAL